MLLNQVGRDEGSPPARGGLICSVICLLVFGSSNFIVPAMAFIIICFTAERKISKKTMEQRRNDNDNNTGNHYDRSSCSRNNGNTLYTVYYLSGRKKSTGVCQISGDGSSYAAIGLLVIYCLKDVPASSTHGLPEAIAILFIVLIHKWKKNTLLSIGGGNGAVHDTCTDCFFAEKA